MLPGIMIRCWFGGTEHKYVREWDGVEVLERMGRDQPRHAVLWIVVNFHTYAPTTMRIPARKKKLKSWEF
jgi:hypothetical protein